MPLEASGTVVMIMDEAEPEPGACEAVAGEAAEEAGLAWGLDSGGEV